MIRKRTYVVVFVDTDGRRQEYTCQADSPAEAYESCRRNCYVDRILHHFIES